MVQKLLHFQLSNCRSSPPELSCPGVITPWHFLLRVISKQQNYGSCLSSKFEKVRGRSRSLVMVKAALLRSDTDLNVSGSVRDDKDFPFMINIPFPQMITKLPVGRSVVHSRAVIGSSCWLCWGMLPEEMLDHQEWNGFYLAGRGCLFFCPVGESLSW